MFWILSIGTIVVIATLYAVITLDYEIGGGNE